MSKKIFLIFITVTMLLVGFLFVKSVKAQTTLKSDIEKQTQAFSGREGANFGVAQDPRMIVARIIKILISFLGFMFTAYVIYGGALWMFSAGNDDQITKAKSIITNGIIGVVVILMSYSIVWATYSIIYWGQKSPFDSYTFIGVQKDKSGFYQTDPLEQDTTPDVLMDNL